MTSKTNKFVFCAAGIFVSYFYFGIMQEKITKGSYKYETADESGVKTTTNEKFVYALSLVFVNCFINYLFAKVMLFYWPQPIDKTSYYSYGCSALTYLLAMVCTNMALQWISYPTQVVGKAAKPIPVLILGVLVGKKSYPLKKYLFVFLIVAGVALFMYKDKSSGAQKESSFGLGELLLLLSLSMDGLTAAVQERMRADTQPTGQQLMVGMNFWAAIFLGAALVVTGEIFTFTEFVSRHPTVLTNMALLALANALGQLFILLMVSDFGTLACSVVTTTRKFFTVLASVVIFGNVLSGRQWFGAVMVFAALFLDIFFSKSPPKKK